MADRSAQLIVAALLRASAGEAPLHKSKKQDGLFPSSAAGKQAARHCQDEGLLAARADAGGQAGAPHWALTEKGFSYLFSQISPHDVLEQLVHALEARDEQLVELLSLAGQMRMQLAALRAGADQVLEQLTGAAGPNGAGQLKSLFQSFLHRTEPAATCHDAVHTILLRHLARWTANNSLEDYPLPELYRRIAAETPGLTIGQYHDALRQLRDDSRVYLHPWTGPLFDMPEPSFALLVGHEVAYYASARG